MRPLRHSTIWTDKFLLEGKYLLLWLQRQEKGQRRCVTGLVGPEDQGAMEGKGLPTTGVLDLAQFPDQDHLLITLVLETAITQGPGPSLLPQEGKVTTLFLLEGMQNALDHLEVLLWSEMEIINAGRILLQVMAMMLIRIKAMDMPRNLCTNLRRIEASGSHQDHPQDLDLDQDLLICHLDVADEVAYWQCAFGLMYNFFYLSGHLLKHVDCLKVSKCYDRWMYNP